MKIQTSIQPRQDGTVIVEGVADAPIVFRMNSEISEMACDVSDEVAADLLALPGFELADGEGEDRDAKPARGKPGPKPKPKPAEG